MVNKKIISHRITAMVLSATFIAGMIPYHAVAAGAESNTSLTMLHTDEGHIVNAEGEQITWRGTNLGAWLLQEAWASPLGTGAIDPDFITKVEGNEASYAYGSPDNVKDVIVNDDQTEITNNDTVWMSGVSQGSGSGELKLTLDKPRTFNSIVLETGSAYTTDYLRGGFVTVGTSTGVEGEYTWSDVTNITIDDSRKDEGIITLTFPDQTGQVISIQPTETADNWWTVANVSICMADEYTVRMNLFRRFGEDKTNELYTTYQNNWITEQDLVNIKNMGMNFVRVPFYWMDFVYATDTETHNKYDFRTDEGNGFAKLDWLLDVCGELGIYCLLDFHGLPGGSCPWASGGQAGALPSDLYYGDYAEEYQEVSCKIWTEIAGRYKDNPVVGGYNLVNEAVLQYWEEKPEYEDKKYEVYDKLYDAIRKVDQNHIVVFEDFTNGYEGAKKRVPSDWENYMFDTHPYDMDNWYNWQNQTNLVQGRLDGAIEYQTNYDVPVLIGEFNVYYHLDVWDQFLSDCNANQISWSNWTYKVRQGEYSTTGGNWAYYNSYSGEIPDILFDDFDEINRIWGSVKTSNSFTANTGLINTVSQRTDGSVAEPYGALNRSGWTASASHTATDYSTDPAVNMLDGDYGTRWSSGAVQTEGMWVQVDMGKSETFSRVEITTSLDGMHVMNENLIGDCPKKYKMEISNDGQTYTEVALNNTDMGFGDRMVLIPVAAQTARYIRITLTEGRTDSWWSINEFNVYRTSNTDGYVASISSSDTDVDVGESLKVDVMAEGIGYDDFASSEVTLSYDASKLTFDEKNSTLNGATVKASDGLLTLEDYGDSQSLGKAYTLAFTANKSGEATVSLRSAKFGTQENAEKSDLLTAALSTAVVNAQITQSYGVTLPDNLSGNPTVKEGETYTFAVKDALNYTYEVTATMGGAPVAVVNNGNGSYSVENVTGDLVITAVATAKSYDVTFQGTGAADVPDGENTATYGVDYTFTMPVTTENTIYTLSSILYSDGTTVPYSISGGTVTIAGTDIKGAFTITIEKETVTEDEAIVTVEGAASDVELPEAAIPGQDYIFTVNQDSNYDYKVTVTVNGEEVEVTVGENGQYTIAGSMFQAGDKLVITVTKTVKTDVFAVEEYVTIDGAQIWLVKGPTTKLEGSVYTYQSEPMFWSDTYGAYCYLIISSGEKPTISAEDIAIVTGTATEIKVGKDVNMSGKVDANDAQLTYNMYNAKYSDFTEDVTMEKFLRADVNGDGVITTKDAAAIVNSLLN